MNPIYVKGTMGLLLVIFISVIGITSNPFFGGIFEKKSEKETNSLQVYQMNFIYHNMSNFSTDIESILISYPEFNSSLIKQPAPNFVGTNFYRDQTNKSLWKAFIWQGINYDKNGLPGGIGSSEPEIYVHENYIIYEVNLFSELLKSAVSEAQTLEENPSENQQEPSNETQNLPNSISTMYEVENERNIPIFVFELRYTNGSSLFIKGYKDDWLEYSFFQCNSWVTNDDKTTYCQSALSSFVIYKEFSETFNEFHDTYEIFVENQIHLINTT